MDLTHREKQDSLVSELREEGGDTEKVGKYVELLTEARKLVLRAEMDTSQVEKDIEEAVENGENQSLEDEIEGYREDAVERYRKAEELLEEAVELKENLTDTELRYAEKIVELERIDMIKEAPSDEKLKAAHVKLFKWAGGIAINTAGAAVSFLGKLSSQEDSEEAGWNFRKGAHLTGHTSYKDPEKALEAVDEERKASEQILAKAERKIEKA